jgi:hypothetical protein
MIQTFIAKRSEVELVVGSLQNQLATIKKDLFATQEKSKRDRVGFFQQNNFNG